MLPVPKALREKVNTQALVVALVLLGVAEAVVRLAFLHWVMGCAATALALLPGAPDHQCVCCCCRLLVSAAAGHDPR